MLRPGGRLLVTTPYHGRVQDAAIALARFERHFDPLGQHLRFYTRRRCATTLEAFAFDDVRIAAWGGPATAASDADRPRGPRHSLIG